MKKNKKPNKEKVKATTKKPMKSDKLKKTHGGLTAYQEFAAETAMA